MTDPPLAFNKRGAGRHYEHPVTGAHVPSVTNVLKVLDRPAIPRWAAKSVAETAYRMRHSLADMEQNEAIDMLKGSPWSKSTRAADRGSNIHDWLEARANGLPEPELSEDAEPYLQSAKDFLDVWDPEFLHTEVTIFGEEYAGTADWIARIGGELVLGDYKSSKAIYSETALQLAALRFGDVIAHDDGTTEPMPDVDRCVAVLITPDSHSVYPVSAGAWEYRAFRACLTAWKWRNESSPVGDPWPVEELAS